MIINFAISKSGHDKGSIYVIQKQEADRYYLVDGKLKTIDKPKVKNKKHIQLIKNLPKLVTEVFELKEPSSGQSGKPDSGSSISFRNDEIKRAIKLYHNYISGINQNSIINQED